MHKKGSSVGYAGTTLTMAQAPVRVIRIFLANGRHNINSSCSVGLSYLLLGLFNLGLVRVACGKLAFSFVLQLKFGLVTLGLFCLRWKIGLVFLLTEQLDLVFFAYGYPTINREEEQ